MFNLFQFDIKLKSVTKQDLMRPPKKTPTMCSV